MSRKSRNNSSSPVVEKLIEQRRLIQEWLAKLESGPSESMPAHVIERVRNDYKGRLAGVIAELGEHADSVRQSLAEAEARQGELAKDQTARRDELAELKLRRQVGELDEGRFKEQSQRLKTAVDDLGKDLAAAARDIDRLEEILDVMGRGDEPEEPPAEAPGPGRAAPAAVAELDDEEQDAEAVEELDEDDEAEEVRVEPVPEPEPARGAAKAEPAVDEMSFLRSVTGVISAQKVPPPKALPLPAAPAAAPAEPEHKEDKPFFVLEQMPEVPAPGSAAPVPSDLRKSGARAKIDEKTVEGEGERTLACRECGALNFPTEWYCEKCGAELSAF